MPHSRSRFLSWNSREQARIVETLTWRLTYIPFVEDTRSWHERSTDMTHVTWVYNWTYLLKTFPSRISFFHLHAADVVWSLKFLEPSIYWNCNLIELTENLGPRYFNSVWHRIKHAEFFIEDNFKSQTKTISKTWTWNQFFSSTMFGQFWQRKSSFIKPNDQFKGQLNTFSN